ncbi:hypothetical protein MRB53_014240 [Persea americana]|uniref:Uncharacterized protein n=1 Tax=Persea americana TaxID=3435 RepID=A0ACC2KA82_PERAE|nr:hypothetical protein MRB53_014240 [Persea americana]
MFRPPSSTLIASLLPHTRLSTRRIAGGEAEAEAAQTPYTEIARKISESIRSKPRWETTLISDFPSLNLSDPNFIQTILIHLQYNPLFASRFFNWIISSQKPSSLPSQSCNTLFDAMLKAKAWKAAATIMCSTKCQLEPASWEAYICGLCKEGDIEEALKALAEFTRLGFLPPLPVWNWLLSGSLRAERTDLVLEIYGEMMNLGVAGDVETIGYLIRAYCEEDKLFEAYVLLREVLSNGFVPDVVAFSKLVSGFCKEGNYGKVSELLHLMIAKNCAPDIFTYTGIIHGLCKNDMGEEAFRVFIDLIDRGYAPDVVTYTIMIDGLCKMGRMSDARKLWCRMIGDKLVPTAYTYNVLIDGHCKLGNLEEARKLYLEMLDQGHSDSTVSCNTMIAGMCIHGRIGEAYRLFEEMVEKGIDHDLITYNTLIQGFCKEKRIKEAMSLYGKLLATGRHPSTSTYTPLIQSLCEEGNVQEAIEMLNDMLNRGLEPLVCTQDYIIVGLCKQSRLMEAMEWLASMLEKRLKPQQGTFNKLLECLCLKDQFDDAFLVLDTMLRMGWTVEASTFQLLINQLCKGQIAANDLLLTTIPTKEEENAAVTISMQNPLSYQCCKKALAEEPFKLRLKSLREHCHFSTLPILAMKRFLVEVTFGNAMDNSACFNMINYNHVAKELTGKPVAWIGGDIAHHKLTESYCLLNISICHNVSPKVSKRVTKEDGYLLYCIGTQRKVDLPLAVFRGMAKVHTASYNAALPFPMVISKLLVDMGKLVEPNEDIIIPKQKIDRFTLEKSKSHIPTFELDDDGEGDTTGHSGAGPSRVGPSVTVDSDKRMLGDDQIGEGTIQLLAKRIECLEVQANEGFAKLFQSFAEILDHLHRD